MEDITDTLIPVGNCPECGNSMIFKLSDLAKDKPLSCPGCDLDIKMNREPWAELITSIRKLHEKANNKIKL